MDYGTMSPADFAAVMGNGSRNGFGGFGDGSSAWWIIILFLFAMNGGWGNNRGGGDGGMNAVPYLMTESTQGAVQNGFNQQSILNGINGINSTLANGFADAAVARCNAQTTTLQALSNNQMGLYQTLNANQNASMAAMNQLAMNLQQCCCDQRQATGDLRYTVATEACNNRQAVNSGVRDIIANQTANTQALINSQTQGFQAIQDKLCQLELDSYKQKVTDQAAEIVALKGAISQTAQTAQIIQDNNAQTANLIRAINPAPVPSYQVPNPYTGCCGNQGYYGCAG